MPILRCDSEGGACLECFCTCCCGGCRSLVVVIVVAVVFFFAGGCVVVIAGHENTRPVCHPSRPSALVSVSASCSRNTWCATERQVVENNLFKKTQLQTSFSGNMLALGSDGTKVIQGAAAARTAEGRFAYHKLRYN